MNKPSFYSLLEAVNTIRTRFLHTFLSVLGIVIGVAALVVILSLIDGMEKLAKDQIANTTSLNSIALVTEQYKTNNNIRIRKEHYSYFTYRSYTQLLSDVTDIKRSVMVRREPGEVHFKDKLIGAELYGTSEIEHPDSLQYGSFITAADIGASKNPAYINHFLGVQLAGENSIDSLLDQVVRINGKEIYIKGVLPDKGEKAGKIITPIRIFSEEDFKEIPPIITLEAADVEAVEALKGEIKSWLKQHMTISDFQLYTNVERLKQATQGFVLFRLVMGLIVGISVLVGGIGVMNVLLISINERTKEIGIRKAVGANRSAIVSQFLAESIVISIFGSFVGLIFGVLLTSLTVPIINNVTGFSFTAAYTAQTFTIICVVAIFIGIVFGTYPALKAARLDPVEAIRKE